METGRAGHPRTNRKGEQGKERRGKAMHSPVRPGAGDKIGRQGACGLGIRFPKAASQENISINAMTWQARETERETDREKVRAD